MRGTIRYFVALLGLVLCLGAHAHEVRPAYLQITQRPGGTFDIVWKQPSRGDAALRLIPHISGGLLETPPSHVETAPGFQILRWHGVVATPLGGREVTIEGLDRSMTDALVEIRLLNGDQTHDVLKPDHPALIIDLQKTGLPIRAYLTLGIDHILTGIDHLAFLLGLLLLVRGRLALLQTITAFTLAHSLTMGATVLGLVHVNPAVVECAVALTILAVATEVMRSYRGHMGLTVRHPWMIAFLFGLLHGCAFAGALSQVGLPADAIPICLFLFNLGVEVGQLLFVVAALVVIRLLRAAPRAMALRWIPPYAIGSLAAFWFFERLSLLATP